MPEAFEGDPFEGDLSDAVFWGADLSLGASELGVGFVQLVGTLKQHRRAGFAKVIEAGQERTQQDRKSVV